MPYKRRVRALANALEAHLTDSTYGGFQSESLRKEIRDAKAVELLRAIGITKPVRHRKRKLRPLWRHRKIK